MYKIIKVKQKVSGAFRILEDAQIFRDIRSYISTAHKQQLDVLETITDDFLNDSIAKKQTKVAKPNPRVILPITHTEYGKKASEAKSCRQ
jgi:hypothetical protein